MVDPDSGLSVAAQCRLLEISRSSYYRHVKGAKGRQGVLSGEWSDAVLALWEKHPTFGYRKLAGLLAADGKAWATEWTVRRIYKVLGLRGVKPKFNSSKAGRHPYGRYPYLLGEKKIWLPNQAWATDITYLSLGGRRLYLTAVIDLYSRRILSWRFSWEMTTEFCIDCVFDAMKEHGIPAIINTDQGSQYTSEAFCRFLEGCGVRISMDGRARWADNVLMERTWRSMKYEHFFMNLSFNSVCTRNSAARGAG